MTYFKKNILELKDALIELFADYTYDYFYSMSKNEYFTSDVNAPGPDYYLYQ